MGRQEILLMVFAAKYFMPGTRLEGATWDYRWRGSEWEK